jgi:collagen type VII alpha
MSKCEDKHCKHDKCDKKHKHDKCDKHCKCEKHCKKDKHCKCDKCCEIKLFDGSKIIKGLEGPKGATGSTGPIGPTGEQGDPGCSFISGNGPPQEFILLLKSSSVFSAGPNSSGDSYLDLNTGRVYIKNNGVWELKGNLMGPTGATGAQGICGVTGARGATGVTGPQGRGILTGLGEPSGNTGTAGDVYVDGRSGTIYLRTPQGWTGTGGSLLGPTGVCVGTTGATGVTGPQGQGILTGLGEPSGNTGVVGDVYVDGRSGTIYLRTSQGWTGTGGSLLGPTGVCVGATGATGAGFLTGVGEPSGDTGRVGDIYVDGISGSVYIKTVEFGWTGTGGSLIGPTGPAGGPVGPAGCTGSTGSTGERGNNILTGLGEPSGSTGNTGDIYVDGQSGTIYIKTAQFGWTGTGGSLLGPTGPQGIQGIQGVQGPAGGPVGSTGETGPTGQQGNNILTGLGAPSGSTGNTGDIYVDGVSGTIYMKSEIYGWTGTGGSLLGPTGPQGPQGAQGPAGTISGAIIFPEGPPIVSTSGVNINNYFLDNSAFYRLTGAGGIDITGFSGGTSGRYIVIVNTTGANVTFQQENLASLPQNRFVLGVANKTINNNQTATFIYVTNLTIGATTNQTRWILTATT